MVRTLLLAATLGALTTTAFAQAVAPAGSGAASNPPNSTPPTSVPPASNQPTANPNMTKPNRPSTPPGASSQAPGREFQDLDSDRNGNISEQEYGNVLGGSTQAYGSVDTNRDGRVSRDEYAKWLKTQPERTGSTPGNTARNGASDSMRP